MDTSIELQNVKMNILCSDYESSLDLFEQNYAFFTQMFQLGVAILND